MNELERRKRKREGSDSRRYEVGGVRFAALSQLVPAALDDDDVDGDDDEKQ